MFQSASLNWPELGRIITWNDRRHRVSLALDIVVGKTDPSPLPAGLAQKEVAYKYISYAAGTGSFYGAYRSLSRYATGETGLRRDATFVTYFVIASVGEACQNAFSKWSVGKSSKSHIRSLCHAGEGLGLGTHNILVKISIGIKLLDSLLAPSPQYII